MYKVFLVDDEIVIREGVRNSFPWEGSGFQLVGEAPDGELALPMIRDENPDILITDIRMPFMDGMELCRQVRRLMPSIQIVILSGFDDFEYARQAISLGVQEYLLKPISARELKAALDRIGQRVDEERRSREDAERLRQRLAAGNRFLREKLLSSILLDPPDAQDARQTLEQMRALGINLMARCYAVTDFSFTSRNGDRAVAQDALCMLAESSAGTVQVCSVKNGSLALAMGDSEADTEERVYSFAQSALYELQRVGCEDVLAAIGDTVFDFSELAQSARSARHIRHVLAARGEDAPAMRIVGARELTDKPAVRAELDVRPLYERLQYAGQDELDKIVSETLSALGAAEIHSTVAADYLRVEALMTASRLVQDAGGDPRQVLELESYERAAPAQGDETDAACTLLRKALQYRDENHSGNPSVAKARAYLAQHFTDPNLMLKDVSAHVSMSNSRFSTVFAQEVGQPFTEYLTALRVGMAKELLRFTDMRSSQIAEAVGYNDPHYFSYLFKKATGQTPSDYRKQS